jgi:hypothetical protein
LSGDDVQTLLRRAHGKIPDLYERRLRTLAEHLDDGSRLSVPAAVELLFADSPVSARLDNFRKFRRTAETHLSRANIDLRVEVTTSRTATERWCWFEGDSPVESALGDYSGDKARQGRRCLRCPPGPAHSDLPQPRSERHPDNAR